MDKSTLKLIKKLSREEFKHHKMNTKIIESKKYKKRYQDKQFNMYNELLDDNNEEMFNIKNCKFG